ncbi:MAG: radical SAM protein [Candidatus Latescibacteria bacterium]|nr:radical SAM protein [Candidatus Latescibacterota bacterium]
MSVDLILWNSIAKRRRSPSDTFLENGLGMLKTYIEKQGFKVEIVDWARSEYWKKLTPRSLSRLNRFLSEKLLSRQVSGLSITGLLSKLIIPFFFISQEITLVIQKRRMNVMLQKFAEFIRDSGCQVLGIKTWYGDAYVNAITLANYVKMLAPEILIVAGGPHPSIYREAILENDVFDIAVTGEGEKALTYILALARHTLSKNELKEKIVSEASLGNLKNIVYRNDDSIKISILDESDANKKEIPTYDNVDGKTLIHVVVDSLGCQWGKCNFCVHSCIYPKHTIRNPQSVVDEIEEMISKGIGIFRFAGSSSSLAHVQEIARLLEKKEISITYSMFALSESRASDQAIYSRIVESYKLLVRSGLRAVFIGGEAGDDRILHHMMGKGLIVDDISATIRAMREASFEEGLPLDIGLSLIYPSPTMGIISLEELKTANIKLVEQTNPDSVLVNPPAPFPGVLWNKERKQFGFELDESFTREMLEYDYVLYKPTSLWPDIKMNLEGMNFKQILEECQSLRKSLEGRGYVTEVTDEHFLMMRAAGYKGKEGARKFKKESLLDIISSDYRWITQLEKTVNQESRAQALINAR